MKSSIAFFSALAMAGLGVGLPSTALAQVPVYQTTVTYTTTTPPVQIRAAPLVPMAPSLAAPPVIVVQQPVYFAPPPAPIYVAPAPVYYPPAVCYAPPVVNVGFRFGGCGPRIGWGVGWGFGGYYGPRGCW